MSANNNKRYWRNAMLAYNTFNEAIQLRNLVDNFFNDAPSLKSRCEYPYIRLYEGNDELKIKAVIPGVKSEDLNIQLIENRLVIESEKKNDHINSPYLRKERSFGKFKKSAKLPFRVDLNRVEADLKDGILSIRLYKSEDAKPRKIEINQ